MPAGAVDRIRITTVVDNYIDNLRRDDAVARRYSAFVAGRCRTSGPSTASRTWWSTRGAGRFTVALDFGLTAETVNHNFRELALDPASIDALALSRPPRPLGRADRLPHAWRRRLRRELPFYGGVDHFRARWQQREERRVYSGRLSRDEIERYEIDVRLTAAADADRRGPVALGRDAHHGGLGDDTQQSPGRGGRRAGPGHVHRRADAGRQRRDRGLVVVVLAHRGIVGICRNATRITGVPRVHAVIGGFHLSGLDDARVTRVVDAFRDLNVEHVIPQHCTGLGPSARSCSGCPAGSPPRRWGPRSSSPRPADTTQRHGRERQ